MKTKVDNALELWAHLCKEDGNMTHTVGRDYQVAYPVGEWGVVASRTIWTPRTEAMWEVWSEWLDEQTLDGKPEEAYFAVSVNHFTTKAHFIVLCKDLLERADADGMFDEGVYDDKIREYEYRDELKFLQDKISGICNTYFFVDTVEDVYNEKETTEMPMLSEYLETLYRHLTCLPNTEIIHEDGGIVWELVDFKDDRFINALRQTMPLKVIWNGLHNYVQDYAPHDADYSKMPVLYNHDDIKGTAVLVAVALSQDRSKKLRDIIGFTSDEIIFDEDVMDIAYAQLGWLEDNTLVPPYPHWCMAYSTIDKKSLIAQPTARCIKLTNEWYTLRAYHTIQKRLF